LALFVAFSVTQDIKCIDNNGGAVDYWVTYKLPKLSGAYASGLGFAYMDESSSQFSVSSSNIDTPNTFLARTLNQLYKNTSKIGYILWNDETPDGHTDSSHAHAKGLLVFNGNGGFFLRHSVPLFPPKRHDSFSYPATGTIYGQTMLCLNLDITNINDVAGQFLVNFPLVYDSSIPPDLAKYKNLLTLAGGGHDTSKTNSVIKIKTKKGLSVTDFAKSKAWNNDLWDALVAPTVGSSFNVETWGRPLMPSTCSTYQVLNVKDVKINAQVDFTETKDHAKWGVSQTGSTTCIGDINRMTSQRNRGGGTSCFNVDKVYKQFSSIISTKDHC